MAAIRTKFMCGWCATAPAMKEVGPHNRCRGYDSTEDVGCLCAAFDHRPNPRVIAYQMRANHANEAQIRDYWRRLDEFLGQQGIEIPGPKVIEDVPAYSMLAVDPATGDLHIATNEDIVAGRALATAVAIKAGTRVRSEDGIVTPIEEEETDEQEGAGDAQESKEG